MNPIKIAPIDARMYQQNKEGAFQQRKDPRNKNKNEKGKSDAFIVELTQAMRRK